MSAIIELLTNKIFISVMVAWLGSQLIKATIISTKKRKIDIGSLFELSGMPSTNVAIISSLATAIYLSEGMSTVFFMSIALLAWVSQELLLSRMMIDKHAEIVNNLLKIIHKKYTPISKRWSHTPSEALVGLILGIISALIIHTI